MWESKGWARSLGSILCSIGGLLYVAPIPPIQVWSPLVIGLGTLIGGAGCANAAVQGTLFPK